MSTKLYRFRDKHELIQSSLGWAELSYYRKSVGTMRYNPGDLLVAIVGQINERTIPGTSQPFKVGKEYLSGAGEKWRVLATDRPGEYPIVVMNSGTGGLCTINAEGNAPYHALRLLPEESAPKKEVFVDFTPGIVLP